MMLISLYTRVAVPLFFMIAGGLLLGRQESLQIVLRKRVVRFVLLIAFYCAVQYAWLVCKQNAEVDVATYIVALWDPREAMISVDGVLTGKSFHESSRCSTIWFLYAYLGLLLMLPLLRRMVQGMQKAHFVYLISLFVVVGVLLPAGYYIVFGKVTPMWLISYTSLINKVLFPFIMGYYIEHYVDVQSLSWRKIACWCGVFFLLSLFVTVLLSHARLHFPRLEFTPTDIDHLSWYVSCYVLLAVPIYVLCKKLFTPIIKDGCIRTVLAYLGNAVLTVMIFENIFRFLYKEYFER